jgi:hypothetical protein
MALGHDKSLLKICKCWNEVLKYWSKVLKCWGNSFDPKHTLIEILLASYEISGKFKFRVGKNQKILADFYIWYFLYLKYMILAKQIRLSNAVVRPIFSHAYSLLLKSQKAEILATIRVFFLRQLDEN